MWRCGEAWNWTASGWEWRTEPTGYVEDGQWWWTNPDAAAVQPAEGETWERAPQAEAGDKPEKQKSARKRQGRRERELERQGLAVKGKGDGAGNQPKTTEKR